MQGLVIAAFDMLGGWRVEVLAVALPQRAQQRTPPRSGAQTKWNCEVRSSRYRRRRFPMLDGGRHGLAQNSTCPWRRVCVCPGCREGMVTSRRSLCLCWWTGVLGRVSSCPCGEGSRDAKVLCSCGASERRQGGVDQWSESKRSETPWWSWWCDPQERSGSRCHQCTGRSVPNSLGNETSCKQVLSRRLPCERSG